MKSNGGFISSQIRHLSSRIFERMLRDSGVDAFNGAQGRILYVLWENERLTITEIGKMTGLAKSTLTSMLDHMEKGELVTRIQNPKNRKQIFIQITENAKAYQQQYDAISQKMTELTYQDFSKEEIAEYEAMLVRIKNNLERYERNGYDDRTEF